MLEYTKKRKVENIADIIGYYENEIAEGRVTQSAVSSEFVHFLTSGIKAIMNDGVKQMDPVWRKLVSVESSNKQMERVVGLGDPTGIEKVMEGQDFPYARFTSDTATVAMGKWGAILQITKELLMDDQSGGKIRSQVSGLTRAMIKRIDKDYAALFNNGTTTTGYDASYVFATTHPDVTGGTALSANNNHLSLGAISASNLDSALNTMSGWRDFDGEPIDPGTSAVLCAPNQLTEAIELVASSASVTDNKSSGVVNVFQGLGTVIPWARLTASTWYLMSNVKGLIHFEREGISVMAEPTNTGASFLADIQQFRVSSRWASLVANWRFACKGN